MAGNPITRIIITAKDEASAVFTSLQAKVAGIAAAIGGYFGARMFGGALVAARDFEAAMSRVQAASGASGAELASLKVAAEQAGLTTKYSATEAAGALENLAKAGLSSAQAVESLPAVLQLASAGGVELGTAAEYITKAVSGMGLAFSDAGRVADVLAMGANASNTSVQGLAGALSYAAPLAQSLGLSLEQTVAIIGKFADAGIDASRAGTALNSILAQFSDPASRFRQELANAGIVTTDFDQALRQLAAAGPAGQKAINAVGQEAGPALRALLNQGIGALDDLKSKLDGAAGSAAETAKTMGQNLDGALKGLGSAWDAARRALVAPLLEPLAKQIDVLAGKFRAAVQDGTIARFGEVIRVAFESGVKAVTDFTAKIDFGVVIARLQHMAAEAGTAFQRFADSATAAANVVQTMFGAITSGANIVMSVVYKIAEAFAGVSSNILAAVSIINTGLSKITFGAVAEGFRQLAAEMQTQAGAMWAVSEAYADKASESFAAAAASAETAANGWRGLTTAATEAVPAVQQTAQALQQAGEQAGLTADQLDALGAGAEVAAGQVSKTGEAAAAAAHKVKAMGDGAAEAAALLEKAFADLGVTSTAKLYEMAQKARTAFETVRSSGTASVRDIQAAFVAYAQKAIEANGGVATAALRAEAAQYRVQLAADSAGKATVAAMGAATQATAALGDEAAEAAGKFAAIGAAAAEAAGNIEQANAAASGTAAGAGRAGGDASRVDMGQSALFSRAEQIGGLDLRREVEASATELARRNRNLMSTNSVLDALSEWFDRWQARLDEIQIEQERAGSRFSSQEPTRATVRPAAQPESITRYEVSVSIGDTRRTINTASDADARALIDALQELERRSA